MSTFAVTDTILSETRTDVTPLPYPMYFLYSIYTLYFFRADLLGMFP